MNLEDASEAVYLDSDGPVDDLVEDQQAQESSEAHQHQAEQESEQANTEPDQADVEDEELHAAGEASPDEDVVDQPRESTELTDEDLPGEPTDPGEANGSADEGGAEEG